MGRGEVEKEKKKTKQKEEGVTKKKKDKVVPSRIELLILALLAPRLNQLGQGTDL